MTGSGGGAASRAARFAARVPSDEADFIQEGHEAALHYICRRIDDAFTGSAKG